MENKEKMIERIAACTGQSYKEVENSISLLTNLGVSSHDAGLRLEEFKQAAERVHFPKKRKFSNYTKPRNRKKKGKY